MGGRTGSRMQALGCLTAGSLLVALTVLGWGLFRILSGVSAETRAAVVAAVGTVVVTVLSVSMTKVFERQSQVEQALRASKIPLYEEFIRFWLGYLMQSKAGVPKVSDEDLQRFFHDSTQRIIVWGSDEVFREYVAFRRVTIGSDGSPAAIRAIAGSFGQLLLAIRKDVGHQNRGVTTADVLMTFLNDADAFLAGALPGPSTPKPPAGAA